MHMPMRGNKPVDAHTHDTRHRSQVAFHMHMPMRGNKPVDAQTHHVWPASNVVRPAGHAEHEMLTEVE